jgi:hypothetical protein
MIVLKLLRKKADIFSETITGLPIFEGDRILWRNDFDYP